MAEGAGQGAVGAGQVTAGNVKMTETNLKEVSLKDYLYRNRNHPMKSWTCKCFKFYTSENTVSLVEELIIALRYT